MKSLLIGVFSLLTLPLSCGGGGNSRSISAPSSEMVMTDVANFEEQSKQATPDQPVERKLIKTGNVSFQVEDMATARNTILEAAKKHQGYVSSDNENKYDRRINNTIVVRVPSQRFDAFLKDATQGVNKFDDRQIYVNDVTEEFLDVQARLKTKKELEERYTQLLAKANTVKDILDIERQIGLLRSEIESIEGRLKYLQSQVSMSTLTLTFYKKLPRSVEYSTRFKESFSGGWHGFVQFLLALTYLWPFFVIAVLAFFVIRSLIRRNSKKKDNS